MTEILDPASDFAIAPITNAPLSNTGTSIVIADKAEDIGRFAEPGTKGYYATVWLRTTHANAGDAIRAGFAEVVRVTGKDSGTSTLTVARGQLGTTAINLNATGTYWIMSGINSTVIDDIDARLFDLVSARLQTGKQVRIVGGTSTPDDVPDERLSVVNSGSSGDNSVVTVQSGSSGKAKITFGDSADGSLGGVTYDNANNQLEIERGGTVGLRLNSSDQVEARKGLRHHGALIWELSDPITLSSNEIAIDTDTPPLIRVTYEEGADTDLKTITGGISGQVICLIRTNASGPGSNFTVVSGNPEQGENLLLNGEADFQINKGGAAIWMQKIGESNWLEISRMS